MERQAMMHGATRIAGQWPQQAAAMRAEASRRLALLFDKRDGKVRGPSPARLLGELSILGESLRREDFTIATASRPKVVMLLPGLLTHPVRMRFMRRRLEQAGHVVHDWGLGFNLGPSEEGIAALVRRLRSLHDRHGQKVALVGWSLGGLFAREIAWRAPEAVSMVVTMGTPFSGDRRANNAWRIYQAVAGHRVEDAPASRDPSEKPPVPTIALWSARDGFISPRSACGRPGERDEAVALRCTHLGFAYSPESARAVLAALDRN